MTPRTLGVSTHSGSTSRAPRQRPEMIYPYTVAMADLVIRMSGAELEKRLRNAGPRTADDVSITRDGRAST